MKIYITLFLLCMGFQLIAQTTHVRIIAKDRTNNDFVSRVLVSGSTNDSVFQKEYTNIKGEAILQVPTDKLVRFSFDHVAFSITDNLAPKIFSGAINDTTTLVVKMFFNKIKELDQVVIKPAGVPDTIFESKRVSVSDFEFLPDNNMVLLTYPKNLKRGTELLVYDGFKVLSELPVNETGKELVRDFRGNPHIVTDNTVYGIYKENLKLSLSEIPKDYYFQYIAPIVDTAHTKYYFSNFDSKYPSFDYFAFDYLDSSYRKIAKITDDLMMELYRAEFKWVDVRTKLWAMDKENETGVDKEIWVGAAYFTQSIYYKELYAPMFEKKDTIFLFDHYKNYMYTYSFGGFVLDSIPIFYHLQAKENGWKKNIIQDDQTGEIFIYFENAGQITIRHFNTKTGKLGNPIALTFKYPEEVKVHNNSVYYIYRPFESIQKKFLYREKLPVLSNSN